MLRRSLCFMLLMVLGLPAAAARGDEVVLHNGDRVSGVVTRIEDGTITIEQTKFGTITAALSDVKSFTSAKFAATTAPATSQPAQVAATAPAATKPVQVAAAPTSAPATAPAPATAVAARPPPPLPKPPPPKPKRWSGAVTATALVTRGNSETESFRVSADALRKGENNTLTLAGGYAFGQAENQNTGITATNIDNWFLSSKLDYSLGPKWYNYALVRVEEDNIANLALRVSPGVGFGYRWINKPEEHFNTEAGINYVFEEYDSGDHNEHVAVRFAYHYDKKLNEKVSLVHNVEYVPSVEDIGDFSLNADVGLRVLLTTKWFADFKAEWRHDSTPAPGAEHNDLRYTFGVGWKF